LETLATSVTLTAHWFGLGVCLMLASIQRSHLVYGFAVTLALTACGGHPAAPTLPNGHKLAIMVFLDRTGAPETPPEKLEQLQQVSDWMEPDLLALLRDSGYDAASVAGVDAGAGPGSYTLHVQIVDYNGGSKAARMFVGFGAGAARLSTHFELLGPNGSSYISGTPGVSTSRADWKHVVRKVDQEIVAAVGVRLRQGL
jgi:hypothetical protein